MGIFVVAAFAAREATLLPVVAITATCRLTIWLPRFCSKGYYTKQHRLQQPFGPAPAWNHHHFRSSAGSKKSDRESERGQPWGHVFSDR
jgi:hypothetical protein